jgi:hypothetical protein
MKCPLRVHEKSDCSFCEAKDCEDREVKTIVLQMSELWI